MEDSQTTSSGSQELQALDLYKQQLAQIQNALLAASDDQKAALQQLEKDLREIIELTESSLLVNPSEDVDSNEQGETSRTDASVNEDLKSLEGTKCRAPFSHEWGGLGYHNAVVLEARIVQEDEPDTETKILVKVVFVNPIHNKMKPCPYYLEGSCKFSDEKCRFSHGCEVPLDSLLDYRETDFALIKKGTAVLGKHHDDGLWYKARVEELLDNNKLSITYEGFRDVHTVEIQDVIINEDADVGGTSSDSEEDSQADFYPRILETYSSLSDDSSQPGLGDWQKHTKGIGLKLLSKMGYVEGKGLGKQGEGRLNPVEAIVFPPGRSLDHCMELREKADNPDLFKVEKRLERQKLKEEKKLKQMADAAEKQNKISVFDFLNVKLSRESTAPEKEKPSVREQSNLKDVSSKGLNVQSFRISEDIKKTEREISKLRESIERQSGRGDVATAASIRQRLDAKEKELLRLQSSERSISKEQKQRKSTSKLTIF